MTLPANFVFSAKSLQSYVDCPRRFQLRYIEGGRPPTMTASNTADELAYEARLRQGAKLHHFAKLSQQGVPQDMLKAAIKGEDAAQWFDKLLSNGLSGLPEKRLPEKRLETTLNGLRLMAQFDLIAYDPGGDLVIVDWKTGDTMPGRETLRQRLQTIVYLYVAAQAGERLMGEPMSPERVHLVYAYLARGGQRNSFTYSHLDMLADAGRLTDLMGEIKRADDFPLTTNHSHCRFCAFRVQCERGEAGSLDDVDYDDVDEADEAELGFEQIGEFGF